MAARTAWEPRFIGGSVDWDRNDARRAGARPPSTNAWCGEVTSGAAGCLQAAARGSRAGGGGDGAARGDESMKLRGAQCDVAQSRSGAAKSPTEAKPEAAGGMTRRCSRGRLNLSAGHRSGITGLRADGERQRFPRAGGAPLARERPQSASLGCARAAFRGRPSLLAGGCSATGRLRRGAERHIFPGARGAAHLRTCEP